MSRGDYFMKLINRLLIALLCVASPAAAQKLDYDRAIHLDAEALSEQGMAEAYASVQTALKAYVTKPLALIEVMDVDRGVYAVKAGGRIQRIFPSPLGGDEYESRGVATAAFFEIVNRQLVTAPVKFYALNAGNDLTGIFLTEHQAAAARKTLKRRSDWPYLPTMRAPWFGQYQ